MPTEENSPIERMLDDHASFVRGVSRALVLDESSADDVAQETWLAAMKHPPRRGGVRSWLGKVARNFSWRARREAARRAAREGRVAVPEAAPRRAEPPQAAMLREVIDAVLALDEPYRSTVLMRFYENLEPSEIAARQGLPPATVRTRLKRALDSLRSRFDAHHGSREAWSLPLLPFALGALKPAAACAAAAGGAAAVATAAPAFTGITIGGIIMFKKIAIAASLVAVAAVSVFFATRPRTDVEDGVGPIKAPIEVADAGTSPPLEPAAPPVHATIVPKPFVPGEEDRVAAEPPLAPKGAPRATVAGRVVDAQGVPQAGVPVSLLILQIAAIDAAGTPTELSDERRVQAKTGGDGRFMFEGLPVGNEARVRARPEKLCDVVRAASLTKPGPLDLGDLVALTGGAIAGTVMTPQGTPAKGAAVRAWPTEGEGAGAFGVFVMRNVADDDTRSAVTNAAGQYRIEGLPDGACAVSVMAEEHPDETRTGVRVRRNEVTWEIDFKLTAGLAITGIVRGADGAPFAGAEVTASPSELKIDEPSRTGSRPRTVTTGADGRFTIAGLRQESWTVRAKKAGFVGAAQRNVAPGTDLALALKACGMAFGRVRNAITNAPIPAFSVRAVKDEPFVEPLSMVRVLRGAEAAKAAGVDETPDLFAIVDLPERDVRIEVRAEDFADTQIGPVKAAAGARIEVGVPMQPQAVVRGIVVDSQGSPVEGARVVAQSWKEAPAGAEGAGGFRVRRRVMARTEGAGPIADAEVSRSGVSGADGTFTIKSLPAGDYSVRAMHRAFAEATPVKVAVKAGDAVDGVKLEVALGGTFAGRALDADGNTLPGARIQIQPKSSGKGGAPFFLGDAGGGREPAISNSEGAFEITGLKAGEYVASIADEGGVGSLRFAVAIDDAAPEGTPVTIEAGRTTRKDLQRKPRASVSGIVKEAGKPAPNVKVTLAAEGAPFFFGGPSAKTDDQGAFLIDDVSPGEYSVLFDPPGAPQPIKKPVSLAPKAEVHLVVDLPTGAIEGRVVDPAGKPIAGVTVTASRENVEEGTRGATATAIVMSATSDTDGGDIQTISFGGAVQPIRTDADGRYRLRYVEAGKHRVSIRGEGVTPKSQNGIVVEENKATKDVDFVGEKGATLLVTVDPGSHDVGSVFVFCEPEGSTEGHDMKNGTTKAPIKFTGLKPGRYRVRVDSPMNELNGSAEAEVVAGQETKITVRLGE